MNVNDGTNYTLNCRLRRPWVDCLAAREPKQYQLVAWITQCTHVCYTAQQCCSSLVTTWSRVEQLMLHICSNYTALWKTQPILMKLNMTTSLQRQKTNEVKQRVKLSMSFLPSQSTKHWAFQGCKQDVWCRDRNVRVSRPRRDRDTEVMVSRRDRDVSATSPRRDVQNNVSRRSVETFKPWLVFRAYTTV